MNCNDDRKVIESAKINKEYKTNKKIEKTSNLFNKIEKALDWFIRNWMFIFLFTIFVINFYKGTTENDKGYQYLSIINFLTLIWGLLARIYNTLKDFIKYIKGEIEE